MPPGPPRAARQSLAALPRDWRAVDHRGPRAALLRCPPDPRARLGKASPRFRVIGGRWITGARARRCSAAPGPRRAAGLPVRDESGGYDGGDRFDELGLRDGADDLLLHLTGVEEDQVRDPADAVARRGARVVVDVHLEDLQP